MGQIGIDLTHHMKNQKQRKGHHQPSDTQDRIAGRMKHRKHLKEAAQQ